MPRTIGRSVQMSGAAVRERVMDLLDWMDHGDIAAFYVRREGGMLFVEVYAEVERQAIRVTDDPVDNENKIS